MFNTNAFRKSVLNQAMQGKLTQQLPEDGDVVDLLQSITEEKQQLIRSGKIKKPKRLATITDDEIPFQIPNNWKWVRLNNILNLKIGKTPARKTEKYWNGNIPWIAVKDMNNGLLNDSSEKITSEAAKDKFQNHIAIKGTMLMSFKLSIGKTCILDCPAYYNEAIVSFNFYKYENVLKPYLFKNIGYLTRFAHSKSAVKGKTLNKNSLNHMLIPIPPLKEQKRIVQNINKCFRLADLIDEGQKLTQNFDNDMYKSLLQSAMQGQLTQQLPEDGNAEDLLQSIAEEKQRLIQVGKIKKPKQLAAITDDEIPFKIPDNWKWVRLANITNIIMGQSPKSKFVYEGAPDNSRFEFHQGKSFFGNVIIQKSNKVTEQYSRLINDNYILMSVRAPVGDINMTNREIDLGRGLCGISPIGFSKLYLYYYLKTQKASLMRKATGSTFKAINKKVIFNELIPVPPLAEQKRIINKLDSLFSKINS